MLTVTETSIVLKPCFTYFFYKSFAFYNNPFSTPTVDREPKESTLSKAKRANSQTKSPTETQKRTTRLSGSFHGASNRTRTCDTAVNSRVLYRLSY